MFVLSSTKLEVYDAHWSAVGFVSMVLLFYVFSVPMMEKRNLVRKPDYADYIKRVPAVYPLPFKKKVK